MKKGLQFLAVLTAFLFVSCEKKGFLNSTEQKIVGTWEYTKVSYTPKWSFSSNDLSLFYEDIELTFYSDYSAKWANTFTGETSTGFWKLIQIITDDEDENSTYYDIYASFTDDATTEINEVVFDSAQISNRTIRAHYKDDEGRFRYVLRSK